MDKRLQIKLGNKYFVLLDRLGEKLDRKTLDLLKEAIIMLGERYGVVIE